MATLGEILKLDSLSQVRRSPMMLNNLVENLAQNKRLSYKSSAVALPISSATNRSNSSSLISVSIGALSSPSS